MHGRNAGCNGAGVLADYIGAHGLTPPRGFVIYGAPGVGKTELALAMVRELQVNIVLVTSSEIRSKVVGQAEDALSRLFKRAVDSQPCVLLVDQLEALAGGGLPVDDGSNGAESGGPKQDRTLSALLSELDQMLAPGGGGHSCGGNNQVLVICTTGDLSAIVPSVLRPGRLDQHFELPLPCSAARLAILNLKLSAMPAAKHLVGTTVVEELAIASEGLSGAHLENVCREAALAGLRADISCSSLPEHHLREALKTLYHRM